MDTFNLHVLVKICMRKIYQHYLYENFKRLCTHKVFIKDQRFNLSYHKFSIKSYVVDVY